MFTRNSKKFLASVSITLAVLLASAGQVRAQFTFGEPENLGPVVNSSSRDRGSTLPSDGLTMLFYSDRPGGLGEDDLWMTTRTTTTDPWQTPVNLGPPVNTSSGESGVTISEDGLTLFFMSARPGGVGNGDLWMTSRTDSSSPWQSPVNLGPTVNSSSWEVNADLSADGLTLFFQSNRPGGYGSWDLWMTTRTGSSDPWQPPVNLGPTVNTSSGDGAPNISNGGLTLFFSSRRPGGLGEGDIWVTTRSSATDPWQTPLNVGPPVNSSFGDSGPYIWADGPTLFFNSNGPGGSGLSDLWQVAVFSDCPADLDGNGEVGPFDLALLLGNWGPCAGCPADFNGDDVVDAADLALLLGSWGSCPCNDC